MRDCVCAARQSAALKLTLLRAEERANKRKASAAPVASSSHRRLSPSGSVIWLTLPALPAISSRNITIRGDVPVIGHVRLRAFSSNTHLHGPIPFGT